MDKTGAGTQIWLFLFEGGSGNIFRFLSQFDIVYILWVLLNGIKASILC